MQKIMKKQFGRAPTVFRPPFGNYNQDTLRAAKSCGIKYAPIWDEEVFVDHWEYREDDQDLHPGDIVLTHFRGRDEWKGTMVDDMSAGSCGRSRPRDTRWPAWRTTCEAAGPGGRCAGGSSCSPAAPSPSTRSSGWARRRPSGCGRTGRAARPNGRTAAGA